MKRNNRKVTAATVVAAVAVLICLGSCKGRTTENVEPTGDTVEVVIDRPHSAEAIADTTGEVTDSHSEI
ncbi:MAG: hypothetical protein K2H18_03165 [Muribaculaceae bacterium]|nr:hypothetical protein [Muribaculaceae bacterium]MDE6296730.1 hypothetical protein [Muribaculaceae bacterium]